MNDASMKQVSEQLRNDLRLKTFPVAARFLKDKKEIPAEAHRPSAALGKKVAVCQGITRARNFGWTVALTKEDVICIPATIVFGFSDSPDLFAYLTNVYCATGFSSTEDLARKEISSMSRFEKDEIEAIVLSPLEKASFEPDTIIIHGNPAQIMRFAQTWSYMTGELVEGHFGGKLACAEYLIATLKTEIPRIVIPGNGERVFAATQDDEIAFAVPAKFLKELAIALPKAGKQIGASYPVTPFQSFQPTCDRSTAICDA
jgi:uncharacterized protein (DUF169 family)